MLNISIESKIHKFFSLMLIVLLTSLVLIAVFTNAQTEAAEVTLEFPSYQINEAGFGDWYRALAEEFEATYPNVEIKMQGVPYADHHDKLTTRLIAKDPPEIMHMSSRFFFGFADKGFLEPLDSYMEGTDIKDSWTPMQQVMVRDGKTYGLLLLSYGFGLFYNEKMFKEAGVNVPTNMEEVIEVSKKLTKDTDGDGKIDQYGIALPIIDDSAFYMSITRFLVSEGGHWTTKDGKITANSPEVIRTLKMFKELSNYSPIGLGDPEKRVYFFEGKAAMLIDGSWVLAMREKASEDIKSVVKVAMPPFPIICGGPSNNLSIPRDISKEKKDIVWKFIELASTLKWQEEYAMFTGNPSPRKGSVTDRVLAKSPDLGIFAKAMNSASESYLPAGFESQFSEFSKIIVNRAMEIITTDREVEDVLNDLQNDLEDTFK